MVGSPWPFRENLGREPALNNPSMQRMLRSNVVSPDGFIDSNDRKVVILRLTLRDALAFVRPDRTGANKPRICAWRIGATRAESTSEYGNATGR